MTTDSTAARTAAIAAALDAAITARDARDAAYDTYHDARTAALDDADDAYHDALDDYHAAIASFLEASAAYDAERAAHEDTDPSAYIAADPNGLHVVGPPHGSVPLMASPQGIIDHHTLRGAVRLSGGTISDYYIDLRAAMLCRECGLGNWYRAQIMRLVVLPDAVVATGAFGALLLGWMASRSFAVAPLAFGVPLLPRGLLWNPKAHGVEWSGYEPPRGAHVVLVDDVATTGATRRAMRAACEARGWVVDAEIVAIERARDSITTRP